MTDANTPTTPVIATVKSVTGNVQVLDKDGNVVRTISKPGEKIYLGDVIKTGQDGDLTLMKGDQAFQIGPNKTVPLGSSEDGTDLSPDIAAMQKALVEGTDPSQFPETEAGVSAGSAGGRSLFYVDWHPSGLEPGDTYPTSFIQDVPDFFEQQFWIVPFRPGEITLDKEVCALNFHEGFGRYSKHFEGQVLEQMQGMFGDYSIDDLFAKFCSGEQPWIDFYDHGNPNAGEPVLYTFRVENTGGTDLSDVVLTDNMAKLLIALNGDQIILGDGFSNGGDFSQITLGDMPDGGLAYAVGVYFLKQEDIDAGFKFNEADVNGIPPFGPPVSDDDDVLIELPHDPEIKLHKSGYLDKCVRDFPIFGEFGDEAGQIVEQLGGFGRGGGNFDPCQYGCIPYEGDTVTYTFKVINTGNVTLNDINLIDNMIDADDIELVSKGNGDDELSPFEFWVYKGSYTLTQEDIDSGFKRNVAEVTGDSPFEEEVSDEDAHVLRLKQCPDIEIDKKAIVPDMKPDGSPDIDNMQEMLTWMGQDYAMQWIDKNGDMMPNIGEKILYGFKITNTGNTTLFNVELDDLDPNVNIHKIHGLEDLDGDGIKDDLAVGEMAYAKGWYTITRQDIKKGFKWNKATVEADGPKGQEVMDMDREHVELPFPRIRLDKEAIDKSKDGHLWNDMDQDDLPDAGEKIFYKFTITNKGNVDLFNVNLTDNMAKIEKNTAQGFQDLDNDGQFDDLAVGTSGTVQGWYILKQGDIDKAKKINKASVTAESETGKEVMDMDREVVKLPQRPDIDLEKEAFDRNDDGFLWNDRNSNGLADAGEKIFYLFSTTNTGNTTLFNLNLTDPMVTFLGGTVTGLEDLDNDGQVDDLAVGKTATIKGKYTITDEDVENGEKYNKATVTADGPKGQDVMDMDDDTVPFPTPLIIETKDGMSYEDGAAMVSGQCAAEANTIAVKFNLDFNDNVDDVIEIRISGIPEDAEVTNSDWTEAVNGDWVTNDATQIANFSNQDPFGMLNIKLPKHWDKDLDLTVSADKQKEGGGPITTESADIAFLIDAVAAQPDVISIDINAGDDGVVEACETVCVTAKVKFCDLRDNADTDGNGAEKQTICLKLPDGGWTIEGPVTLFTGDGYLNIQAVDMGNGLFEVDATSFLDSIASLNDSDMAEISIKANVIAPADLQQEIVYSYEDTNPGGNNTGGDMKNLEFSYNSGTEKLSFAMKIDDVSDGFTLAISPGDNPKGDVGELALIYFDASNVDKNAPDAADLIMTVYEYNGQNNDSSWNNPGNLILSSLIDADAFDLDVMEMNGDLVYSFMVDATAINQYLGSPGWTGVEFGDEIGVWLHPFKNLKSNYNNDGELIKWKGKDGWYDIENRDTDSEEIKPEIEVIAKSEDSPTDGEKSQDNNSAQDSMTEEVCIKDPDPVLVVGTNGNDDAQADDAQTHTISNPNENDYGEILGGKGMDVLVGDVGGIADGDHSFAFMLDVSGSMNNKFGGDKTRIQVLKEVLVGDGVTDGVLQQLAAHPGQVKLFLVPFATDVAAPGDRFIDNNFGDNPADLSNAINFVNGLSAGGWTNYKAPHEVVQDWYLGMQDDGFTDNSHLLTDGNPNTTDPSDGGGAGKNAAINATVAAVADMLDQSTEMLTGGDEVNMYAIGMGTGVDRNILDKVDNTPDDNSPNDLPPIAENAGDLQAILTESLSGVGDDTILGGQGDDIIFGDVLNTTHLDANGDGLDALIDYLEDNDLDSSNEGILTYIKDHHDELSGGPNESRGGHDLLKGEEGSDVIYGQGGDDIIIGGEGRDHLHGGQGEDTFAYRAGDGDDSVSLADVIYDFDTDEDSIGELDGLTVNILDDGDDAIVEDASTNEVLAVIENVDHTQVQTEVVVL